MAYIAPRSLEESGRVDEDILGKTGSQKGMGRLKSHHCSWYLDPFSRFCRAHERDKQTDRHTNRPCYSVCSNRPHLAITAIGL